MSKEENGIPYNRNPEKKKKSGVAILISDKGDFKPKLMRRDKGDHYIF